MVRKRNKHADTASTVLPGRSTAASFLVDETRKMEHQRRLEEQEGHRRLAKVHAREYREEDTQQYGAEETMDNNIHQHPNLDNQRFDGVDPNLNPEPPLNSDARREYDNAKREQEREKQLRLGLAPGAKSTPKPQFGA